MPIARSKNGKGSSKRNFASNHEYVLLYGKSVSSRVAGQVDSPDSYDRWDEHGRFKVDGLFRKKGDASRRVDRPNLFYPLYYDQNGKVYTKPAPDRFEAYPVDSMGVERRWLWSIETADRQSWKLWASPRGAIYVKNYFSEGKRTKLRSLQEMRSAFFSETATRELKEIYGERIFETGKPLKFIEFLLASLADENSLILDFFAGTGTTAEAAENLNRLDGGQRRVWLMESTAPIKESHRAYEMGYRTVADITRKRLSAMSDRDCSIRFREVNEPALGQRQFAGNA